MKLKALVVGPVDRFHDELVGADGFPAGVAFFTIGPAAPEARDAVMREVARSEFTADEETKGVLVHLGLGGWYSGEEEGPHSPEA